MSRRSSERMRTGRHYESAIVPARPAKPRYKAKVEVAVQVADLAPARGMGRRADHSSKARAQGGADGGPTATTAPAR
jgi:hypothetical protein